MPRAVRIVGDPDVCEVIGETPTSMILVNPTARRVRDLAALRMQIAALEVELARTESASPAAAAIPE